MAFTGLHVVCAYTGPESDREDAMSLIGKAVWAQTFAVAGTTTEAAPLPSPTSGAPVFQVRAAIDAFVAAAPIPDASSATSKRFFVPAGERVEFYVQPGDKLAWVAA
jgi:hypothetical protein